MVLGWLTRFSIALALIAALAVGATAWRLSKGPVELDRVTGWIERQLGAQFPGSEVTVGAAVLSWDISDRRPIVSVQNLKIVRPNRTRALTVRNVDIHVSRFALLAGKLAPASLELKGATVQIRRSRDGQVLIGVFEAGALGEREATQPSYDMVSLIREAIPQNAPYLEAITLSDANVRIFDQITGANWFPPVMNVALALGENASLLSFAFGDEIDRDPVFYGFATFRSDVREFPLTLQARDLRAADLPNLPALDAYLAGLSLTGNADLSLSARGRITSGLFRLDRIAAEPAREIVLPNDSRIQISEFSAEGTVSKSPAAVKMSAVKLSGPDFELAGGARIEWQSELLVGPMMTNLELAGANLKLDGILDQPVAEFGIKVTAGVDLERNMVQLAGADLKLDNVDVTATGIIDYSGTEPTVRLSGTIPVLPAKRLKTLWPKGLVGGTRNWINENIKAGTARNGVFQAATGKYSDAGIPQVRLEFDIENAVSTYAGNLPPIENATGKGVLTANTFEMELAGGTAGGLVIERGRLSMQDTNNKFSPSDITLNLRGSARNVLKFLEKGPFGYPQRYGIDPDRASGDVTATINLTMPLIKDVRTSQIKLAALIKSTDLALVGIGDKYDISDGVVEFDATTRRLKATGGVSVNGVPMAIDWLENFDDRELPATTFFASARLSTEDRQRLYVPLVEGLGGTATIAATYRKWFDGHESVAIDGDLTDADFDPPLIKWSSPAGDNKRLRLNAELGDGRTVLRDVELSGDLFSLEAPEIVLVGDLATRARVSRIQIPGVADTQLTWARKPDGLLVADIRGEYLNAASFLGAGEDSLSDDLGLLELTASLRQIRISDALILPDVGISVSSTGQNSGQITGKLTFASGNPINVEWVSTGPGTRRFQITARDAGRLGRALGLYNFARGGDVVISGTADRRAGADLEMSGTLSVRDVTVFDAPVLAQIMTLGSLTGIRNTLTGEGIHFQIMEVPFQISEEHIVLGDSLLKGRAIGLTFSGDIHRTSSNANIDGTIIPAYRTNTLIGKVPVLGDLLTGGEDEGIFGITFSVRGAIDDPTISANPLSALAPGILRKLFDARSYRDGETLPAPDEMVDDR